MKILLRILRWAGIQQYLFLYQTKNHRRAEMRMGAREYITWIATMTINTAEINGLTTEAILRDVKRMIHFQKEIKQNAKEAERTQDDLSYPSVNHIDIDTGEHKSEPNDN